MIEPNPLPKDIGQGVAFIEAINSPLTYSEGLRLSEQKRHYESLEGDIDVFGEIEKIRAEVEPLEGWKAQKDIAQKELEVLPLDTLDRLNEKFTPYIKNLPAGHGRGHLSRDFVGLSLQLRDPEFAKYDPVEVFVGVMGGLYHDIGNSVVGRYDDGKRFSGHAEVGAHLFGEVVGDDLPPSLKKLTQYAIAAHTNYLKDISIEREGETRVRKTYKGHSDMVEDDGGIHKAAICIARNTDRLDLLTPPFIDIRHFATKTIPTMDFDGDTFHTPREDEVEDFLHQFSPVLRNDEERLAAPTKQDQTMNVLEHLRMLGNSALYGKFNPENPQKERNDYSKYDTDYFTGELVVPAVLDQARFIEAVVNGDPSKTQEEVDSSFERFYRGLRLIEPAHDTSFVEDQFRQKFARLPKEQLSRWANGFDLLLGDIDKNTQDRLNEKLNLEPSVLRNDNSQAARNVKAILNKTLQPLARSVVGQYSPESI